MNDKNSGKLKFFKSTLCSTEKLINEIKSPTEK